MTIEERMALLEARVAALEGRMNGRVVGLPDDNRLEVCAACGQTLPVVCSSTVCPYAYRVTITSSQ